MELDARLILTIVGMAISVISAAAIAKQKLQTVIEQLTDIEKRLRVLDQRVDKSELTDQRVSVLSKMLSPDSREKEHKFLARIEARLDAVEAEVSHLRGMHNHKHPVIKET